MQDKLEKKDFLILLSSLMLFTSFFLGILSQKHIFLDGSRITFDILMDQNFKRDYPQFRVFNFLLQTPTLFLIKVTSLEFMAKFGPYILGFSHLFFSFFCFLYSSFICLKKNNSHIIPFILLSHCLIIGPGISFLHNYAFDSHSLIWPLITSFLFLKGIQRFLSCLVFIICLTFTYETSALILLLISLASIGLGKRNKYDYVIFATSITGAFFQIYVSFFLVSKNARNGFFENMFNLSWMKSTHYTSWAFFVILYITLLFFINIERRKNNLILALLTIIGIYLEFNDSGSTHILYSFRWRTWIIPLQFILILGIFNSAFSKKNYELSKNLIFFIVFCCLTGTIHELRQIHSWMQSTKILLSKLENTTKCQILTPEETDEFQLKAFNPLQMIHYQVLISGKRYIKKIIYPNPTLLGLPKSYDYCNQTTNQSIPLGNDFEVSFKTKNLKNIYELDLK